MHKQPDKPSFFEKLATAIVDRRNLIFFLLLFLAKPRPAAPPAINRVLVLTILYHLVILVNI